MSNTMQIMNAALDNARSIQRLIGRPITDAEYVSVARLVAGILDPPVEVLRKEAR